MHNNKLQKFILVSLLLISGAAVIFYGFGKNNKTDSSSLRERAEKLTDEIILSMGSNPFDKLEIDKAFYNNADINQISITNNNGVIIAEYSKIMDYQNFCDIEKEIKKHGTHVGNLRLRLTDNSFFLECQKTADRIILTNSYNISNYNINDLKSSANIFFKDKNIKRLLIKDIYGNTFVDLKREAEPLHSSIDISRAFYHNGTRTADLLVSFSDISETESGKSGISILIIVLFMLLLIGAIFVFLSYWIFKDTKPYLSQKRTEISTDTKEKIESAIEYIKHNYNRSISREGLACMVSINPDYLGKLFKQYTGLRLNDYINKLRIENAAILLKSTEKSITEIAFEVGFDSMSTFYRLFTTYHKTNPVTFRNN